PLTHGRPESATHQWVDFRQTIPLQYHHPAGPLARAVAKDATGNLSLVRIERRIWRSEQKERTVLAPVRPLLNGPCFVSGNKFGWAQLMTDPIPQSDRTSDKSAR